MFGIGATELIIILVIVLILFGAGRLPQIGEGLGKAIRGFKRGLSESEEIDVTPTQKKTENGKEQDDQKKE